MDVAERRSKGIEKKVEGTYLRGFYVAGAPPMSQKEFYDNLFKYSRKKKSKKSFFGKVREKMSFVSSFVKEGFEEAREYVFGGVRNFYEFAGYETSFMAG